MHRRSYISTPAAGYTVPGSSWPTSTAVRTSRDNEPASSCLVTQRSVILLAKEVASLDVLPNGRFLFGIGVDWSEEGLDDHCGAPRARRGVVCEKVHAMQALRTRDEVLSLLSTQPDVVLPLFDGCTTLLRSR